MSYSNPERRWKSYREGYLIRTEDGRFVNCIIANGHPETPIIYTTKYTWDAKVWKTANGAIKAAAKIEKATGKRATVWHFRYNSASETRDLADEPLDVRMEGRHEHQQ